MKKFCVIVGLVFLSGAAFAESFLVNDFLGNTYVCTITGTAVFGTSLDGRLKLGNNCRVENGYVFIRFHDGSSKTFVRPSFQERAWELITVSPTQTAEGEVLIDIPAQNVIPPPQVGIMTTPVLTPVGPMQSVESVITTTPSTPILP